MSGTVDREYIKAMVDDHEDVVDRLQTRTSEDRLGENKGEVKPESSNNPAEASLNQWAAKALSVVRHTSMRRNGSTTASESI